MFPRLEGPVCVSLEHGQHRVEGNWPEVEGTAGYRYVWKTAQEQAVPVGDAGEG